MIYLRYVTSKQIKNSVSCYSLILYFYN